MSNSQYAILPSNPADRKKIIDAFKEISNAKTRAEAEMDYIKESVNMLAEEFEMKKPALNKMWRLFHKGTAKDEKAKLDEVFEAYATLTGEEIDE